MANRPLLWIACLLVLPLPVAGQQSASTPGAKRTPTPPVAAPAGPSQLESSALSDKEVAATQRQLVELLRGSPTLTTVVSHDPSLLADQQYVSRNNPRLAEFLVAHPEVARNPDYYLFTHLSPNDGSPDEALQRTVWPQYYNNNRRTGFDELLSDMPPVLGITVFLAAVVWAIRLIIDNRRWSRVFKLQSEVHGRLIEKFSSSQEIAAYMQTEAGRRFLEAAPIPLHAETPQRVPNAVARVLTPIQIGIVLVLLGAGFLILRHAGPDYETPMLVLGVLILMPGIGFIISAGITWILALRLGLMPSASPHPHSHQAPYPEQ